MANPRVTVEQLGWTDAELGTIPLPKAPLHIRSGFGSGLATRAEDPPGMVWAVGDRGPNLKVKDARKLYGAEGLDHLVDVDGAKLMPRLDLGPALAQMRVGEDRVELVREIRITGPDGKPISGLPVPEGPHAESEPAFRMDGRPIPPDPAGLDTEGVVALADGGFWVGDEFGPSLVRLDEKGRVLRRLVPQDCGITGPRVEACLPKLAARRKLNRGFESLALSADERWLFLAFQSPLAHPDEEAHEGARHVRLWRLDAQSGEVAAEYLYPLDPPESFRRDSAEGPVARSDLKVSELLGLDDGSLVVLERGSHTTKLYRVSPREQDALPDTYLDIATRPSVEELSAAEGFPLPVLAKTFLFSTDDHPEVARDLEGLALLSPSELLLVSDNDFGVEGAVTSFWRLRFDAPLA